MKKKLGPLTTCLTTAALIVAVLGIFRLASAERIRINVDLTKDENAAIGINEESGRGVFERTVGERLSDRIGEVYGLGIGLGLARLSGGAIPNSIQQLGETANRLELLPPGCSYSKRFSVTSGSEILVRYTIHPFSVEVLSLSQRLNDPAVYLRIPGLVNSSTETRNPSVTMFVRRGSERMPMPPENSDFDSFIASGWIHQPLPEIENREIQALAGN